MKNDPEFNNDNRIEDKLEQITDVSDLLEIEIPDTPEPAQEPDTLAASEAEPAQEPDTSSAPEEGSAAETEPAETPENVTAGTDEPDAAAAAAGSEVPEAAEKPDVERTIFGIPKKRTPTTHALMLDAVLAIIIAILIVAADSPGKVTALKVTDTTFDTVSLSWEATEKASGYHIYRSEDGKDYDYLASTTDTSYRDLGVTTGKTYLYCVTAFNGIRRQGPNERKAVEAVPELEKPELKGSIESGVVKLSFDRVDGAIGYEIFRDGKKIGDQKETEFLDEEAKGDTDYVYKVRAYRYKKNPVYSAKSNKVSLKLIAISRMGAEIRGEDLVFTWDATEEYTSYEVYKGDKLLETTSETSYVLEDFDPDKKYEMKLIGVSEDQSMKSPANIQTFEIESTPMTNQEALDAACDWGIAIADDNSFTYGTGKRAHRCGCYFCGTNVGPNKNIKGTSLVDGHSYEKTYCCNPFVHACFAHGAGDPGMLKVCQNGGSVGMSAKSYTRFGNWRNVGKPARSDLQRGDVLVRPDHVSLYIGDGQILQAVDKGWTDESIRYNTFGSKSYSKYKFVMRYTGNGSGTRYEVKEVPNEDKEGTARDRDGDKAGSDKTKADKTGKSEEPETGTET